MTKYYPMMINIKNKKCLVVGGGNVAYRKIYELIEYGAKVTLVSKEINEYMNFAVENTIKKLYILRIVIKRNILKMLL